jgi:putative photosynthetic complex assembly protein
MSSLGAAAAVTDERIPRLLVRGIAVVLLLVLLSVAAVRLGGFSPVVEPGALLAERHLAFADGPDGSVRVSDARSGEVLAELRGELGFLRGVLRGLARDRRAHGAGRAAPYVLSLHKDGRLLISDPETGQRIDLASFGRDNAAVFLRWLPPSALESLQSLQSLKESKT